MKKRKIVMISSLVLSTIMLFNGCTSNNNCEDVTFVYSDEDLNNFATDKDLKEYYWYVIETYDGKNYELKLTKKANFGKMDKQVNEYYYTDALKGDYQVYAVLYNHDRKLFWVETGPEIISAVPLIDYLDDYNLRKASYSKEELEDILELIKEDYNKEKELNGKDKVLIKDNSLY